MSATLAKEWGLQERVCCPHCWERFPPERSLWITTSPALKGDPRLGAEHQQRFLPERFTADGDALDRRGFPCQDLACPNCHLGVPRACVEMEPLFLSILGAPGSGKSVFLGAMTGELREILVRDFCLSFADADPALNELILRYENELMQLGTARDGAIVPIVQKVLKTDANLYTDRVRFESGEILFPRPFVFSVQPAQGHPNLPKGNRIARAVSLYDNAGESFEPGRDTVTQPYTRHLAQAQALLVVVDPTQDAEFQKEMRRLRCEERVCEWTRRQDDYIHEAARRIRKFARMRETERFKPPVIVVLTKCDAWWPVVGGPRPPEPWKLSGGRPFAAFDVDTVDTLSKECQQKLRKLAPRITGAIEGFAGDVTYIPVSAAGWNTTYDPETGRPALRQGEDSRRHWVCVPFLYALRRIAPTLIAQRKKSP